MQTSIKDAETREREKNQELADVLTAISVVSKRLAQKLTALTEEEKQKKKGGEADEQEE